MSQQERRREQARKCNVGKVGQAKEYLNRKCIREQGLRFCNQCKACKPVAEFARRGKGLRTVCRPCQALLMKLWTYKITLEEPGESAKWVLWDLTAVYGAPIC